MLTLLLLLALPDDPEDHLPEVRVYKQNRSVYIRMIQKLKDAESMLESDPALSADKCTEVIESKDLENSQKEFRVRIEYIQGGWGDWVVLKPYQLRGRARLARAESLGADSRVDAVEITRKAVEDLKKSLTLGAGSSRSYLARAEGVLVRLAGAAASPPAAEVKAPPSSEGQPTVGRLSEKLEKMMKEIEVLKGEIDRLNQKEKESAPKSKTPPSDPKKE